MGALLALPSAEDTESAMEAGAKSAMEAGTESAMEAGTRSAMEASAAEAGAGAAAEAGVEAPLRSTLLRRGIGAPSDDDGPCHIYNIQGCLNDRAISTKDILIYPNLDASLTIGQYYNKKFL